jgi:pimeloyl-ACP methyl ester carboxylesterase
MVEVTETASFFGRDRHLFGVRTSPRRSRDGSAGLIILNAGILHRVGPHRLGPEIARAVAGEGFQVLRFDLSGIGDSHVSDSGPLEAVVDRDIQDAIAFLAARGSTSVVLLGLCSGADNAFHVAGHDERVQGLVLIDPYVQPTRGFRARRLFHRMTSLRAWGSLISGRALLRRIRAPETDTIWRPPAYYGLLLTPRGEAVARASEMTRRGVRFLYVLTGGVHGYCNSPRQIEESMPGAFDGNLRVEWRPEADHLLSRKVDREWLFETVLEWLQEFSSTARAESQT